MMPLPAILLFFVFLLIVGIISHSAWMIITSSVMILVIIGIVIYFRNK